MCGSHVYLTGNLPNMSHCASLYYMHACERNQYVHLIEMVVFFGGIHISHYNYAERMTEGRNEIKTKCIIYNDAAFLCLLLRFNDWWSYLVWFECIDECETPWPNAMWCVVMRCTSFAFAPKVFIYFVSFWFYYARTHTHTYQLNNIRAMYFYSVKFVIRDVPTKLWTKMW